MFTFEKNKCAVTVGQAGVVVAHADFGIQDVTQALRFGHNISEALDSHSPTTAWWSALVAEERYRLKLFQEGVFIRYMAHCRYYAKLALVGLGYKETLEAVKDYVVMLFSKERTKVAESVAKAAWHGHLLAEHHSATGVKKYLDSGNAEQIEKDKDSFHTTMYSWETDQGVTYDGMVELELEISKNVEALSSFLEVFQQRGILLSSLAADRRVEAHANGVRGINQLSQNLTDKVKQNLE